MDPQLPETSNLPPLPGVRLVWRCLECGFVGSLDGHRLPDVCPDCSAPKTEFEYVRED